MEMAKISSKGQITIPISIRERLHFRKLNQIRGMCRMFTNMDLFSLNLSFQTFHKLRKNLKRKNYRTNKEKVIDFFF